MRRRTGTAFTAVLAVASVLALSACGSSSNNSSTTASTSGGSSSTSSSGTSKSGTVTLMMGTAPQSLDPGMDYTTQGAEPNWVTYLGLLTYAHANGTAGAQLIPALATSLPKITDGGKTYTLTLRKGLVFSNGQPVHASDFAYTVERAIKIPWGGSGQFITPVIAGGTAFSKGAKSISGITTNDATGQIVIHLTAPYGPFANVLAFPAMGIIPKGTPFQNEPNNPPPGVGPYKTTNIVPNQSFESVPNPEWSKMSIPGVPAAKVSVQVKIDPNVASNALSVLNGSADFFDWADTIPGSLIGQIHAKAASNYKLVNLGGSTYYIFLNSQHPPFNNQLAREAVVTALSEPAMNRLGSGTLAPGCFFLPPAVPGHPTNATCPYGDPAAGGNIAKAKALVAQAHLTGTPVTVWSETRTPRQQWMTYYTQLLNQIGFHATQKVIADATYFTTIGQLKLHPQTGFADWNQDFPNPVDFYGVLLDGKAILPTNNENFGETNDPYINAQVAKLGATPTTQIQKVVPQWQALDEYVAKKAYAAVFGYQTFPFFTSSRVTYSDVSSIYGWDFTAFSLK